MQASRQDELYFRDPLLDGVGLGLGALVVLFEVVGEVAVEVEAARVVATLTAVTGALFGHFEAVGVHGRHYVDPGVIHQPADVRVAVVVGHEVLQIQDGNENSSEL